MPQLKNKIKRTKLSACRNDTSQCGWQWSLRGDTRAVESSLSLNSTDMLRQCRLAGERESPRVRLTGIHPRVWQFPAL